MEVKIKNNNEMIDATIEMVDGVMVVSPKEVKFEPKDGDVCKSINCIYIFKEVRPSYACNGLQAIVYHCCYNGYYLKVGEDVGVGYLRRNQRYATGEEKKLLFDKLAEVGYEFDFDNNELVKLKWKPSVGQHFYYPEYNNGDCSFIIKAYTYAFEDQIESDKTIAKGWCFKTAQECQEFCNRLNEVVNQVKP